MVRLVFRPYTQVGRSICTSESLRTSTRVSSGLVLPGHSSPSFGCQRVRSRSAPATSERLGRAVAAPFFGPLCGPGSQRSPRAGFHVSLRHWVSGDPLTRAHVRLLGPCFKTGRVGYRPTRRKPRERLRGRKPRSPGFSPPTPSPRDQPGRQEATSLPSGFSAPFPEGVIVRASRQPGEAHGAWTG